MSEVSHSVIPVRILLKTAANVALVWALATYVSEYFIVDGGWTAYIIIGALVTLLNMIVRPILAILTAPLRLIATILAIVIVNGVFIELVHMITQEMRPELVQLDIAGGLVGWVIVACAFGLGNWLLKEILR